jgi:predicted hydrocarbon binding protein
VPNIGNPQFLVFIVCISFSEIRLKAYGNPVAWELGVTEETRVVEPSVEEASLGLQRDECFNPLDLGRMVVLDAGQKWYGVVLEADVEKGVVRRLAEIAEDAGIIIRFIQYSVLEENERALTARALVFLDFSNTSISPWDALRLVRKQPFVKKTLLIAPSAEEILYDNYFFPLVVGGKRAVIFRRRVYESLFKGVRETFGTAGEAMLYYQGFAIGRRMCQAYREDTGLEDPKALVGLGKAYFRTVGWGILDVVKMSLEAGEAQVRVYQSFECETGRGSETPYGHFIRGILAGFFTNIFGEEAKAVETKCIAKETPTANTR